MIAIHSEPTRNGKTTLSLELPGGQTVRLHSAFDPEKEAHRSTSAFSTKPGRLILVAGCGLAYHIKELKEKYPHNTLIILERYPEVTEICRKKHPQYLEGSLILHREDEISPLFEQLNISVFKGTSVFFHRQSYALDTEFYDSMISSISQILSSKISDLLTRFEFEERWVENIFRNIPSLERAIPASSFYGKFAGIPGVLVSAGPSLKDSAASLRQIADSALIVCVDTAYKVLLKHGITPHMVMLLDAQKHSLLHFLGTPGKGTVLLSDIVGCPQAVREYQGDICISTTSKYYDDEKGNLKRETTPCVDWLEKSTGPLGDIQSGGSVATSLFDFLLNCGCSSITLVGQDLAYTGRKIHATGTYHNERWLAAINRFSGLENINQAVVRKRKIRYVPSVSGKGTVLTDYVLDLYRRWFSDSAKMVTIPVYNATAEGAVIEGAIRRDLKDLTKGQDAADCQISSIIEEIISGSDKLSTDTLKPRLAALRNVCLKIRELSNSEAEDAQEKIAALADSQEAGAVFAPFLKRTRTYLDRHTLEDERKEKLIRDDILRSSLKILSLIDKTGLAPNEVYNE